MLTKPTTIAALALLCAACITSDLTACRDTVLVVRLDWTTERACGHGEATLEPIATDHPGSLAYLCRCPTPDVEETP